MVNNSRHLLLEERGSCPNLASKILSMALRRLSNDWQRLWGDPVAVVESFVDEGRYEGTCYRACGFVQAGQSAGFSD